MSQDVRATTSKWWRSQSLCHHISNCTLLCYQKGEASKVHRLEPGRTVQTFQGVIVPAKFAVHVEGAMEAAVSSNPQVTHPQSGPSAELPQHVRTVRIMFADFAARGRSGLNSRELNWTAPVKLAPVQSSPWLQVGSYLPNPNRTAKKHRPNKPTTKQTNSPRAKGGGRNRKNKGVTWRRQTKTQNKFSRQRRWTLEDMAVRNISRT